MTREVRRVITGHDPDGRARIEIDELRSLASSGARQGIAATLIWSTATSPADNGDGFDGALRPVGTTCPGGTVFRIVELQPGVAPRIHRTDSVDYVIILSGEIAMELDGSEVLLRAGDVLVQRGTVHNWINRGPEPCVMAAVVVDAKPVEIAGRPLPAHG